MTLTLGQAAPNFALPSQQGHTVRLSDFRDKWVVLYFYPKDNTSICTREACSFRDQYEDFQALGAQVIGVSMDSPESHQRFAEEHKLPFLLLSDTTGELHRQYGVKKTLGLIPGRVTFLIDPQGIVRHIHSAAFQGSGHVDKMLEILKKA